MRGPPSFAQGLSSRIDWDQPQGHRESKGLFTRCALHPKQDLFRGTEPGPRLKFHPKAGVWRGAPYTTPRPNSAPAPALRSGLAAPARGGARSPATARPRAGATLARRLRPPRQPELRAFFTKIRSSSPFGRARERAMPTLLRRGRIIPSRTPCPTGTPFPPLL